jgi:hypothetical protein
VSVKPADLAAPARVLNERGYLVVQSILPLSVGDIMQHPLLDGEDTGVPARVVSVTDRADFMEQLQRTGFYRHDGDIFSYFYRVSMD